VQITGIGGMGTFTAWVDGAMIGTENGSHSEFRQQRIGFRATCGSVGEMWIDDRGHR